MMDGVEVGRVNLPAGPVTASTRALASIEPTATTFTVPAGLLRAGKNVIAASVHNSALDSSDLSFDCVLCPYLAPRTAVSCSAGIRRGDVQGDGAVDVGDAVRLLFHLFLGDTVGCPDAADIDDSGDLRINDATLLLDYLFLAGKPPAAPGEACGPDPTPDSLPPCTATRCPG